jgi:hypothetical protein
MADRYYYPFQKPRLAIAKRKMAKCGKSFSVCDIGLVELNLRSPTFREP